MPPKPKVDWGREKRLGKMPDVELARELGVARTTVTGERTRRGIPRSPDGLKRTNRRSKPEPERDEGHPHFARHEQDAGPYYYDETRDVYVFSLPSKPHTPFPVRGETVRSIVAAYAKDGDNASINEVARAVGWHRKTVREVLQRLGKTHDSMPFTDEQIGAGDEDELTEDLVRRKEERIHIRAEREDWKRTKELADKARDWTRFFASLSSTVDVPPAPRRPARRLPRPQPHTLVTHASDLHYGKSGWVDETGDEYSREVCRDRLLTATSDLLDKCSAYGRPSRIVVGMGADMLHIDNHRGTTTGGTPQDHDGSFMRIYTEACALGRDQIEEFRGWTDAVDVFAIRGNHDYYSTALMVHWLQAHYRNTDVNIGRPLAEREYVEIGNTLLGLTHGHSIKDNDLISLMAHEAGEAWSRTRFRMWLTGHWHTQKMYEKHGVLVEHLPSLAGTDRWHNEHGYVGNRKGLVGYLIHHTDGPFARIFVDAKKVSQ